MSKVGTTQVGFTQVGITQVGTKQFDITQVGFSQVGTIQVGIAPALALAAKRMKSIGVGLPQTKLIEAENPD